MNRTVTTRFVAIASALLLAGGVVMAEERNLKPLYDFVIEVNGKLDKAWQIFAPTLKNRFLLIAPNGATTLFVSVPDRAVRAVDRTMMLKRPDGTLDLLAGAVSPAVVPLSIDGANATFTLEGQTIEIKPRPALVGQHTVEELVADQPLFGDGMKSYQPEPQAIAYLKTYPKPTIIEVYFGTWCPHCQATVPKALKSLESAGNPNLQLRLIGVARNFENDPEIVKNKGVNKVPTFIIRQDGVETDRFLPPEDKPIEAVLAEHLKARS